MEGAATTVYAQGGKGNARLMAWEGERTVTFTMEDALISPAGLMILSGAGLIEATEEKPIMVHTTEPTAEVGFDNIENPTMVTITLSEEPHFAANEDFIYVMLMHDGEVDSEPFIPSKVEGKVITLEPTFGNGRSNDLSPFFEKASSNDLVVLVDYYVARKGGVSEISITPDKFGGYYYLEASTLFRNTDGVDMPAEFIIPNCKIQSAFNFTMASTGDPSTFTFTIDAFPDYTRFNKTKKVLAVIQMVTNAEQGEELTRIKTHSEDVEDSNGMITRPTEAAENE